MEIGCPKCKSDNIICGDIFKKSDLDKLFYCQNCGYEEKIRELILLKSYHGRIIVNVNMAGVNDGSP